MKILVTGATGYIGSHLVRRLLQENHEVSAIVRESSDRARLDGVACYPYDGSAISLSDALEKTQPALIIHLASIFLTRHQSQDVEKLIAANILFPAQLLDAATRAGTRYVINTGTGWQHYQDADYDPVNLYAATKQAFESLLEYYVRTAGISAISLKILDSLGPSDPRPKLLSLLRRAVQSQTPLKMSPGEQTLDFVYIDDIVDAFLIAIQRVQTIIGSETFGLGSGQPVSLRRLVEAYSHATGRTIPVEWGALPYREREVMTSWAAYRPLPGWQPKVPLAEALLRIERAPGGLLADGAP